MVILEKGFKALEYKAKQQEKVLEIIKEKDVDMYSLRRCKTSEEYNEHFAIDEYQKLTEEEFDLLKRCFNERFRI